MVIAVEMTNLWILWNLCFVKNGSTVSSQSNEVDKRKSHISNFWMFLLLKLGILWWVIIHSIFFRTPLTQKPKEIACFSSLNRWKQQPRKDLCYLCYNAPTERLVIVKETADFGERKRKAMFPFFYEGSCDHNTDRFNFNHKVESPKASSRWGRYSKELSIFRNRFRLRNSNFNITQNNEHYYRHGALRVNGKNTIYFALLKLLNCKTAFGTRPI